MSTSAAGRAARLPRGRRLMFASGAVLGVLLLLEGGLRLAGWGPLPRRPVGANLELLHQYTKFVPSERRLWDLAPGWIGREGQGTVRINRLGLREREIAAAPLPGTFRLLCLGDSVTFGYLVEAEEAWPRRLEEALQGALPGPTQTINAGVPGYSPFQELDWLREQGWSYGPDGIVVGFVLNDVVERYLTLAAYGGDNTVLGVDTTVTLNPLHRLVRRTALHGTVTRLRRAQARRREEYSVRRLFDEPLTEVVASAWGATERELASLAAEAAGRGVPLLLVLFPFRFQLEERLPARPQERLMAWAQQHRIAALDLTSVFARLGRSGLLDQDHPTPAGHFAAAQAIAAEIRRLGWRAGRGA